MIVNVLHLRKKNRIIMHMIMMVILMISMDDPSFIKMINMDDPRYYMSVNYIQLSKDRSPICDDLNYVDEIYAHTSQDYEVNGIFFQLNSTVISSRFLTQIAT